jgi:hypothetical protein
LPATRTLHGNFNVRGVVDTQVLTDRLFRIEQLAPNGSFVDDATLSFTNRRLPVSTERHTQ